MDPAQDLDFLKINISKVLNANIDQFNHFVVFFQSIEWSEPWLIGLVAFHVIITLLTVLTRKRAAVQAVLFFLMLILIYLSEQLNEIAADNWRYYSKQQYFDRDGMFISLMFSAPLLFNCMLMVANWLLISSELMTSLRRFQLQENIRKLKKPTNSTSSGSGGSGSRSSSTTGTKKKSRDRVKKD